MDKPLKDWTLKEIKAYCLEHNCDSECCFFGREFNACKVLDCPNTWNLTDSPRFTSQEAEDAKVLLRAFPCYDTVERNDIGTVHISAAKMGWRTISRNMFPSVKPGETVSLKEIAGYTE
jgi:hypothetical protein